MLRIISLSLFSLVVSCQGKPPYAPAPRPVVVESVAVEVGEFGGRPDVFAVVAGRLSSTAALLVDPRQSREGQVISLEVLEQTPRPAMVLTDLGESPPFETRIPIGTLGLEPGRYSLAVNGLLAEFEIPPLQANLLVPGEKPEPSDPAIVLVDEFIPIESVGPTIPAP